MNLINTILITVLFLLIQGNPMHASPKQFPPINEIQRLIKEKKVPGISMVIIENGEIAWHLELGVKIAETLDPIEETTLFEAASLSKPVFAYGVLKMVENGQLNLDKPLIEYLPYPDVKDDKRLNLITARMVLAHTTGFPNWRQQNESLKIYFQPGEKFSYSGEGFVYLQKVIERLSGLSLEDYLKKTVFIPLGMKQSTFVWMSDIKALGHTSKGFPVETNTAIAIPPNAAFTLHTTALDYAKFVIALLKGIGLKSEIMDEMFRPQIRVQERCIICIDMCSNPLSDTISWGLGWGLQHTKTGDSFWHWGDNNGFKSFVVGSRNRNQALIVFTNSSNGLSVISEVINNYMKTPQPAFEWLKAEYSDL